MSAKAEPTPPEIPPINGPNNKPVIITPISPIFIYPWVAGILIGTIIVNTKINAENTPIIEITNVLFGKEYPLKSFHFDGFLLLKILSHFFILKQ